MTPEGHKPSEINNILATTAIIGGIYLLSQLAFSLKSRQVIFKRDKGTCQITGERFSDGYVTHAAHLDHDKKKADYDDPKKGFFSRCWVT